MPRPRKHLRAPAAPAPASAAGTPNRSSTWAEQLGEALGRGVARGIHAGLSGGLSSAPLPSAPPPRAARRGRPPKLASGGPVPADRRCKVAGCDSPARSKGLCSRHYQAARRHALTKKKKR